MSDSTLRDEAALSWNFLEDEHDPCIVVSERMELVYINGAAQRLVPEEWFGKRCFEVFPVVDETCAFHCPKIDAVSESPETSPKVVYCEETVYTGTLDRVVLGVGLVPLGEERADHARAVFVLRTKDASADARAFESNLLQDAEHVRQRVLSSLPAK